MEILFVGSFYTKQIEEEIWRNSVGPIVISGDTFQKTLLAGLRNRNIQMSILTIPAIGSYPNRYKYILIKGIEESFLDYKTTSLSYINITFIKKYSIYFKIYKNVSRWIKNSTKDKTIIIYSLIPEYINAVINAVKKDKSVKIVVIALDIMEYVSENPFSIYSRLATFLSLRIIKSSYTDLSRVNGFVLLTKHMIDYLNIDNKPSIILEGIFQNNFPELLVKKLDTKTILYTGSLDKRFGLDVLLSAFQLIEGSYELWVCGEGSMKNTIIEMSKKDPRIVFWGLLKREEVIKKQKEATILVNPRQPIHEFTKFSFPSKTMEYMASGTPTLMYKLPGLPSEYDEYLVYFNDTSINTMKEQILEWCNKSQFELDKFGAKARQFIIENKNEEIQSMRIINFINSL